MRTAPLELALPARLAVALLVAGCTAAPAVPGRWEPPALSLPLSPTLPELPAMAVESSWPPAPPQLDTVALVAPPFLHLCGGVVHVASATRIVAAQVGVTAYYRPIDAALGHPPFRVVYHFRAL